ncbi:hypothetical protein AB0945_27935 [Streptomyces sp. NPDC005474]|uniref:hypothetical protein n=1 Tax=Streptomyces sp. NPDC005474 TaxID=3154878 RepID=UPI003455B63C
MNEITLFAVQALLGLISDEVIAVGVCVEGERVELVFWVRRHSTEVEDDAEEATFELDSLFSDDHPLIEYAIKTGEPDPKSIGPACRMIYWAKIRDRRHDSGE